MTDDDRKQNGWKIATMVLLALLPVLLASVTLVPVHNLKEMDELKRDVSEVKTATAVNNQRYETIQQSLENINSQLRDIDGKLDDKQDKGNRRYSGERTD